MAALLGTTIELAMPKNIKSGMSVVDPLQIPGELKRPAMDAGYPPEPKLSDGMEVTPKPDPDRGPSRSRVRRRAIRATARTCPSGHAVAEAMKFCPECGSEVRAPGPALCSNGHEVNPDFKFCSVCGVPVASAGPAPQYAPRDPAQMSTTELASYEAAHRRAVSLGNENPSMAYAPGNAPPGAETVIAHFLVDGVSAFGNVWYRGQEVEVWPGHPRWGEAQDWINLDMAGQFKRYGRQLFGHGPWPGERSYTAGAGHFEQLADSPPPTEEELARADEAEQRRGRRVPMPLR